MAFFLVSCKVQVYPSIIDGSKADGTLTISYEVIAYTKPIVHWEEVIQSSRSKCQLWGYKDVEFFGGGTSKCNNIDLNGNCCRWLVTYKCQCTNQ